MMLFEKRQNEDKLVNLLKRHCDAEDEFLKLFREKEINMNILVNQLDTLRSLRQETLQSINFKREKKSTEEEDEKDEEDERKKSTDENEENDEKESYILIQDRKFTPELITNFSQAKNEIVSVYKCIEKNTTPVLNLNHIKDFILNFSNLIPSQENIQTEIPDINIDGITAILSTQENSPLLILKSNRKVIITTKNYDFTDFNYDELIEILRFFDILISDTSYDHVRTEIVRQINTISSISIIKF